MELIPDVEIVECPSCQGKKTIHWGNREYPCLLCRGTGEIELKAEQHALAFSE